MNKIDRRNFISSVAATVAFAAKGTAEASSPQPARSRAGSGYDQGKRPKNVVLMICDDLGYGDLGCYGSKVPTPNLDGMASEGNRFTRFNAGHPICSASRAALLTGRYGQRSGVTSAFFPKSPTGLALDETTLANLFQNKGFRTKAIGKWHLGDAVEYLPTKRGFDSFYGVPYSDDMQPLPLTRDTTPLEADTDRDLLTPRYTTEAVKFLRETSPKPFFLYLAYSYPHDPARASAAFRGKSGFGDYGDSVQEIDWSVGEVMRVLRERNLLEDTLVIFTSDHGPWYQGSPGNLRGRKSSTFEGGFRVPFIAHWPADIKHGIVSSQWSSSLDVLPSLTALCGLNPPPKATDGIDITPTLLGEDKELPRKALLYFSPFSNDLHCVRKGDWKLRFAQVDGEMYISDYTTGHQSFWLPRAELYYLADDPSESYDVSHQHLQIVSALLAEATEQIASLPEPYHVAFANLQKRVAAPSTPPAAAPRPRSDVPLPGWAWEPADRRG